MNYKKTTNRWVANCFIVIVFSMSSIAESAEFVAVEQNGEKINSNIAAASMGAIPFSDSDYGEHHTIDKLNDGKYGNNSTWISSVDGGFAGVRFKKKSKIAAIAFGRDNTGKYSDRCIGQYSIQYTQVEKPTAKTPANKWQTIATIDYADSGPAKPAQRHLFRFDTVSATAVRIVTKRDEISARYKIGIDELEVYPASDAIKKLKPATWRPAISKETIQLQHKFISPLIKKGQLDSPVVEVTPLIFKDRLYILENWRGGWKGSKKNPSPRKDHKIDEIWIRDQETGKYISRVAQYHSLSTAIVHNNQVYVFALPNDSRGGNLIHMYKSSDLKNWSKAVTVAKGKSDEHFFNTAICRGDNGRFIMLIETNDRTWPAFTLVYYENDDINDPNGWKKIRGGLYGTDKYVGGPALYYDGGYYYTLYLQNISGGWESRVTRSKDLIHWQDAPTSRPFLPHDAKLISKHTGKEVRECNASDPELIYWKGKTLVYFTGGNQHAAGDLQLAEFNGTPQKLFESFFPEKKYSRPQIIKRGTIDLDLVEITPIVFKDKLYRFESVRTRYQSNKTGKPYYRFIDTSTGKATPPFAAGHDLGSAMVDGDTIYVFGPQGWGTEAIDMYWSKDLKTWKKKRILNLKGWKIFNTSVCKADGRYIMAFEVGGPKQVVGNGFTNRFAESKDLMNWKLLEEPAVFTKKHYSACPTIRYLDGYFYIVYLHSMGGTYNPYIVRSRDLAKWESSKFNPIMRFSSQDKRIALTNFTKENLQIIKKAGNRNNSDMDFCEYQGQVIINYSWGDQRGHEFLAEAFYPGTLRAFLTGFFPKKQKKK